MSFIDYFRRRPKSAALAKDRLSIIVARERVGSRSRSPDYLPRLQQELLAVIARYENIDLGTVSVNLDHSRGTDVLELNIILPDAKPATTTNPSRPVV